MVVLLWIDAILRQNLVIGPEEGIGRQTVAFWQLGEIFFGNSDDMVEDLDVCQSMSVRSEIDLVRANVRATCLG